jgi:hypothetical protein
VRGHSCFTGHAVVVEARCGMRMNIRKVKAQCNQGEHQHEDNAPATQAPVRLCTLVPLDHPVSQFRS